MGALAGRSVPRADGPAKVAGTALYVGDVPCDGMLVGAALRSAVDRGLLVSITPDPSFDWTGISIVTAVDVPVNEVATVGSEQPVLVPVGGEVRHRYEPLALVAAPRTRLPDEPRHPRPPPLEEGGPPRPDPPFPAGGLRGDDQAPPGRRRRDDRVRPRRDLPGPLREDRHGRGGQRHPLPPRPLAGGHPRRGGLPLARRPDRGVGRS